MTDLGPPYPRNYDRLPPHMAPLDFGIWYRYQQLLPADTIALYFDVGLGEGKDPGPDTTDTMRTMWRRLTQKRADVVVDLPKQVLLVELRDSANANAVGRMQLYLMLWKKNPPINKPVLPMIVTNYRDADVAMLCEAANIQYLVV